MRTASSRASSVASPKLAKGPVVFKGLDRFGGVSSAGGGRTVADVSVATAVIESGANWDSESKPFSGN